ncbi:MAG TPA: DUF72 domain-containing protein [Pyrinomonadaceae bacterium]|nr:DUF72 domain-containing protein [Pyrinomonadaceae bacterium]
MKKPLFKAGCCGFRMARADYAAEFPVVEVQQTFYQPPQIKTLRRWREESPAAFEFTLKAWQLITHEARSPTYKRLRRELTEEERAGCGAFRRSPIVREAWDVTRACAEALDARRVLFQCPASFTPTAENLKRMREFFGATKRGKLEFLWEPRGAWPDELVRSLCDELDLTHVVDPFVARTVTTSRARYFRLHGRGGWRYQYEDGELEELLSMLPRGKTSYVLFNNVRMREDASRFQELARQSAL